MIRITSFLFLVTLLLKSKNKCDLINLGISIKIYNSIGFLNKCSRLA